MRTSLATVPAWCLAVLMLLGIGGAVTTGCGTSAQPDAGTESPVVARNAGTKKFSEEEAAERKAQKKVADEKKAAQEKDAANSYVKIKVEVELRGVLASADEPVTISIVTKSRPGEDRFQNDQWVLDFGENKEMRSRAKGLDGKTVLVNGSATLQYVTRAINSDPRKGGEGISLLDVERRVAVKSLVAATKE